MNTAAIGVACKTVRCAVYTRKSTEEGLNQVFNSLDAQREAAEAYIASQCHEGWLCLPQRYDDGGFTGANMDRPALKRLLDDIQAGHVDCVLVQKVDRLSRSLLDFAKMMETFDRQRVAFVSVTQQFNTATSMGRLVLNVLLSFAQFEREIISERTRDKIAATRRKGKWSGGVPLLGYDLDPRQTRLVVNPKEAVRVRAIFALYLELGGLLPAVRELKRRRWRTKRWRTRHGQVRGGRPFTKTNLHRLLTRVAYIGKVHHRDDLYDGEQPAIVAIDIWQQVQDQLKDKRRSGGGSMRNKFGALLQGLLRCVPCGSAMTPTHAIHGSKCYRYYLCCAAHRHGRHSCPSKAIPAEPIERLVLEQIQSLEPALGNVQGRVPALPPDEQLRLVQLRIERVDYDGTQGKVAIAFRPGSFPALPAKAAAQDKETDV
ncbi:MAG TPA: recombinase family protein [Gemmataceae bacterium]|nr:recombinase family protein [Gemmataceae bacterium]